MATALSISVDQRDALELVRQEKFVANGQPGFIDLLKYEGSVLAAYTSISTAWDYGDSDSNGRLLPPDVQYELRIAESLLTANEAANVVAIKHDGIIYQIQRPSPYPPQGMRRFWRFWISPQEPAS